MEAVRTPMELVTGGQAEELDDEELVLVVLRARGYEAGAREARKQAEKALENRLIQRGNRSIRCDEYVALMARPMRTEYSHPILLGLRGIVEESALADAALQTPSALKYLADTVPGAESIINQAKMEVEADEEKLKIRKIKRGGGRAE